jgi:hypothetical protein
LSDATFSHLKMGSGLSIDLDTAGIMIWPIRFSGPEPVAIELESQWSGQREWQSLGAPTMLEDFDQRNKADLTRRTDSGWLWQNLNSIAKDLIISRFAGC